MNATQVLKKLITTLSLAKEEVRFTYAKLADGTILESPTFDIGETVEVVSEDGKSPAPAGEHEIILRDSEGNDVMMKIEVDAEGKITEKEIADLVEEVEMESIAGDDMGDDEEVDTEETAEPISEDEDMKSVVTKLQYRIEELEKKYKEMAEVKEEEISEGKKAEKVEAEPLPGDVAMKAQSDEDEEELPKLDGAPIDENAPKQNGVKLGKKNAMVNPQNSFLSKLYK